MEMTNFGGPIEHRSKYSPGKQQHDRWGGGPQGGTWVFASGRRVGTLMNFRHPKSCTGVKKMNGKQECSTDTYKSGRSRGKWERRSASSNAR